MINYQYKFVISGVNYKCILILLVLSIEISSCKGNWLMEKEFFIIKFSLFSYYLF